MAVSYVSFGRNHENAEFLFRRADELDQDPNTYDQAVALYREAIRLKPDFADAIINLGNVYARKGLYDLAVETYRKALACDNCPSEGYYNLGYVLMDRGSDLSEVLALFKKSLELNDTFADAHFNIALAYERNDQYQEAQRHWRKYVELEPTGNWSDMARRYIRS